jgi:hypothetical protein
MISDFRTTLKALGLSSRGFATLTGVHEDTVSGWGRVRSGRGVQEVPRWAWLLLDAWRACPDALREAAEARETHSNSIRQTNAAQTQSD